MQNAAAELLGTEVRAGRSTPGKPLRHPGGAESEIVRSWVESAMGRVGVVARRYIGCGLSFDDLLSAGNVGLVEAALRFDPKREVQFSTYADWWIRKSILTAIQQQTGAVRLPRYRMEQLRNLQMLRSDLRGVNGEEPTTEELADASGLEIHQVRTLLTITNASVSLDQPLVAGGTRTVGECIPAGSGLSQADEVIRGDQMRRIRELLEDLPPRQQQILSMRFGLLGNEPMSLREIGDCVGVSRERVRQIEQQALQELRARFDDAEQ